MDDLLGRICSDAEKAGIIAETPEKGTKNFPLPKGIRCHAQKKEKDSLIKFVRIFQVRTIKMLVLP